MMSPQRLSSALLLLLVSPSLVVVVNGSCCEVSGGLSASVVDDNVAIDVECPASYPYARCVRNCEFTGIAGSEITQQSAKNLPPYCTNSTANTFAALAKTNNGTYDSVNVNLLGLCCQQATPPIRPATPDPNFVFRTCPGFEPPVTTPLCSTTPELCSSDDNTCVTGSCDAATDTCQYTVTPGYVLVNGECMQDETLQCTSDTPPCPSGQREASEGCCEPCPSGTYEMSGACIDCPPNTSNEEGSSGEDSCVEVTGGFCPTGAPTGFQRGRQLGFCDDECPTLNANRKMALEGIALKNFFSPVSPGAVADLAGGVEALGLLGNIANVGNIAAGAAQGASAALLEASKAFIDSNTSGNLATAVLNAALALEPLLQRRNGAAIWIKLSADCCLSTSCCIIFDNNEWVKTEKWHKCSATPKGGIKGLGFMPGDANGIKNALPGCIVEAVRAFKCP